MDQLDFQTLAQGYERDACASHPSGKADCRVRALDYVTEAVITTDLNIIVTGWNAAAEALFGRARGQAIGRYLYELLDRKLISQFFTHTYPEYAHRRSFEYDHSALAEDGARIPLRTAVSLLRDDDGRACGYVCVTRDTMRSRKADDPGAQISQTDSDFLKTIDSYTEGGWAFDFTSRQVSYSEAWLKRIGLPKSFDDGYQDLLRLHLHPDDREAVKAAFHEIQRSRQEKFSVQCRVHTIDRGYIWALLQGRLFYNDLGEPYKVLGTVVDITEEKQMELQLEEQRDLLRRTVDELTSREKDYLLLLNTPEVAFFVEDLLKKTLAVSPEFARRLGIDELIRIQDPDVAGERRFPEFYREYRKITDQCLSRGVRTFVFDSMGTLDGGQLHFHATGRIVTTDGGVPIKIIGFVQDTTRQKVLELELRNQARELEQKNRLVNEFFTGISHEFRTPLSIILMANDLLDAMVRKTEGDAGIKATKFVAMLRQNSLRLQRLITNLLDMTKIDAGLMSVNWAAVDLVALLKDSTDAAAAFAAPMGVEVAFLSSCHSLEMALDAAKTQRVVLNLLSNAIKHTPAGGHVCVHLKVLPDSVTVSVADDGDGIPEDRQNILFNRFRLVNTALTRDNEGCGMGLALSKALAELLGGDIHFTSSPGAGSVFYVDLPHRSAEDIDPTPLTESMSPESLVELEFSDITHVFPRLA